MRWRHAALTGVLVLVLGACGEAASGDPEPGATRTDPAQRPVLGACRDLGPDDVDEPSNSTPAVSCTEEHTAQTFAVGTVPDKLTSVAYDDAALSRFAFRTCTRKFQKFLGADESLVMRTLVSWAWFRPPEDAWADGARWYRCDVVGGGNHDDSYVPLPDTAEGLLLGRPDDDWMVCATGDSVTGSPRVPCSAEHDWRAVTTIKLGEAKDDYPGDRLVEVTTRDYCSESVGAWLNYPPTYDYGYTWFHEAEWSGGNRRSVCWARTAD